jgi:hypothetical protein
VRVVQADIFVYFLWGAYHFTMNRRSLSGIKNKKQPRSLMHNCNKPFSAVFRDTNFPLYFFVFLFLLIKNEHNPLMQL